ncbi:MAG: RNA polymerase sigma-70 factor [Chryseolinea sp.]
MKIVDQIRNGDISAYEKIYNQYYGSLCFFAKKIVGDMDKARDIVQEILVKLYTDRETLQINISLKSYLFKCVYNASLNSIKQQKVRSLHHEYLKRYSPVSDDHDLVVKAELEEMVRGTIEQLPPQCRRIFKMNRYQGKKNSEIAEELGISIRTVETQISKALAVLRVTLADFLPTLLIVMIA